jgi:methionyl-tRNA formyltransferase
VRATGRTPIDGKTAGELTAELAEIGAKLMVEVLDDLPAHPPIVQPELGVTYAAKIGKAEARIDFNQSADYIERQVRAFNPVSGAFFEYEGERYKVLEAENKDESGKPGTVVDDRLLIACNPGSIRPTIIQRAGKPAMPVADFLRGKAIPTGTHLS